MSSEIDVVNERVRHTNAVLVHRDFCMVIRVFVISLFSYMTSPFPNISDWHHSTPAALNIPFKSTLFGLSIGTPNARSRISCARGPNPLLTPNATV